MKPRVTLYGLVLSSFLTPVFGQDGSPGSPYTDLGQAWHVPSDGVYHFDISGNTFSTYVETGTGWILIASGSAATTESFYTTTTALTLQSDAILPATIYASVLITGVRMNATSGPSTPFDVQSSNATVLSNLQNDRTLSVGTNSGNWTGTGTARLARSCASNNNSLSTHIYHSCGNNGNLHWQVGQINTHEKIVESNSSKNDLNLWVRAEPVELPIRLLNFDATFHTSGSVYLDWQTASELQNDYFTVERSLDGNDWEHIQIVDGAGNSSTLLYYFATDETPYSGTSYYRIKQTDFDGHFDYSPVKSVDSRKLTKISIALYPNPTKNQLTIEGDPLELRDVTIYNVLWQNITALTKQVLIDEQTVVMDLSQLPAGIYYIRTKTTSNKILKL